MKNSRKLLIMAFCIISSSVFSEEIIKTDKGLSLSVDSIINVGIASKNYKIEDYKNTSNGVDEDTAFFQLGIKKKIGNVEAGAHLRYGAGFETNGDRTGGDMFVKYNFNNKLSLEYQKSDFKYVDYKVWSSTDHLGAVVGKNLGTGTQLELTPEGMIVDPVLSSLEVDYGVAFLAQGTNGVKSAWGAGDFTPDGAIWSAHIAYKENANNHDMKPGAFNLYYNGDKLTLASSTVYLTRNISGASENYDCTDMGTTLKAAYNISEKTKLGGGVTYGNGVSDSSNDTNDLETTIFSQNLWYKTQIGGLDFMSEIAHSNFKVDSDLSFSVENLIEYKLGQDKELYGAYAKLSKFVPKIGIPALEIKVAQSIFDEANGTDYANDQKNTLIEIKPSLTIPSHKVPGLLYGFNATFGSYKSENVSGVAGDTDKSSQIKVGTYLTYIY